MLPYSNKVAPRKLFFSIFLICFFLFVERLIFLVYLLFAVSISIETFFFLFSVKVLFFFSLNIDMNFIRFAIENEIFVGILRARNLSILWYIVFNFHVRRFRTFLSDIAACQQFLLHWYETNYTFTPKINHYFCCCCCCLFWMLKNHLRCMCFRSYAKTKRNISFGTKTRRKFFLFFSLSYIFVFSPCNL